QYHAHVAAGACISGGHESGALLVGRNDQINGFSAFRFLLGVEAKQGIVGRKNCAAAVPKQHLHALIRQHLDDHIRARHGLAGEWVFRTETSPCPFTAVRPGSGGLFHMSAHRSSRTLAAAAVGSGFCFGFCRNDIISRSCLPTVSIGCLASSSRIRLKLGLPASFSAIHCLAKAPFWTSVRICFIVSRTCASMTLGPRV